MQDEAKYARLDPQAAEFLRKWEKSLIPSLHELPPEGARELVQVIPGVSEPVGEIRDFTVPGNAGRIGIRLIRPIDTDPGSDERLPCMVFYHGGGWVVGSIGSHEALCRRIANAARCAVASVEYRLAPEHKYPAAVDDSIGAVRELQAAAGELRLDPARFAVCGDSAGGNLAAVVALALKNESLPLAAQVLLYPITNHSYETTSYEQCGDGYYLSRATMEWFWNHYLPDEQSGQEWRASPLLANDYSSVAPAWVMTAEFDPLRDEGIAYAQRLRDAGVAVEEMQCPGMIHGFVRRVDLFDQARQVVDWLAQGLRQAFTSEP